jgi:hypothetical protein
LFEENVGVGCIGFSENGEIISAYQHFWKKSFVSWKDKKGAEMGSKTTTLEMLGVLFNVILNVKVLSNQHVVFMIDNIACYYGWISKYVKEDSTASIIIRCIGLLSAYLGSRFHFKHLPRLSNWEGKKVDRLSRRSSSTWWDKRLVSSFGTQQIPLCLQQWLTNPEEDWALPEKLLQEIMS